MSSLISRQLWLPDGYRQRTYRLVVGKFTQINNTAFKFHSNDFLSLLSDHSLMLEHTQRRQTPTRRHLATSNSLFRQNADSHHSVRALYAYSRKCNTPWLMPTVPEGYSKGPTELGLVGISRIRVYIMVRVELEFGTRPSK